MDLNELAYRKCTHLNIRRFEECKTLIDWLDIRPGERVLDIGCGDGFWSRQIAERGAEVVGIDPSEKGVARANQVNRLPGTEYRLVNAEQMDFADGSFDKVVSMCVIEHFHDEDRVLEHVARVLRPGGRLVLSADSLSNPEVTEAERAAHRQRYAVNTFYDLDLLRAKLARVGLELERHRFILTTPLTLRLVRWTWKLDDLPPGPATVLGDIAYFAINTVGRALSALSERRDGRADSGLTLLATARKPG
jgi:2-polyprenyl-3-methyl-5-hydroxy-6-metoxy-1,4-benzoquinol methylase